jgi:hypothetical protein
MRHRFHLVGLSMRSHRGGVQMSLAGDRFGALGGVGRRT